MCSFQLSRDKTPSPNGFSMELYPKCWDVIKRDLMKAFQEFHNNG